MINYFPIIGMEIHVELKTNSKMFCGCKNDPFHAPKPNTYTCPVCLGLPGALPVANKKAIEWTIKLGLALGCEIPLFSKFDRKNYFYPDLPKGYQISQYDMPLAVNGWLEIPMLRHPESSEGSLAHASFSDKLRDVSASPQHDKRRIRITRVHLEEDTGKLLHATVNGKKVSLIDFNRSGVPLVEIVTEPDIHSAEEAKAFLKKLHQIVRYLDISDAEMEKGSMRLEPNISVAVRGKGKGESNEIASSSSPPRNDENIKLPSYKVEIKNINSFNFVKKAIDFEVQRHIELLEQGETPVQETRGWDEKKGITYSQRRKEEAHDYRYFPDPDLPPMQWQQTTIDSLQLTLPELPDAKVKRLIHEYHLSESDATRLTETRELADYFEDLISNQQSAISGKKLTGKDIANWLLNKKVDISRVEPAELIKQIVNSKVKVAVDPEELSRVIHKVISENTKPVADYKAGKTGVLMFLVGMCMKELKGKGDAQEIRKRLEEELKS